MMCVDSEGENFSVLSFFLLYIERFCTGVFELCKYLYNKFDKISVPWKRFRRKNGHVSKRSYNRENAKALLKTKAMGKVLKKVAAAASYVSLAIDIGIAWSNNYESGSDSWITDSIVDTVYICTQYAIGAGIVSLCSMIPLVGWLIGIVVSLSVNSFIQWIMENGLLEKIKSFAAELDNSINNWWNDLWGTNFN